MTDPVVCEVGPVLVRRLDQRAQPGGVIGAGPLTRGTTPLAEPGGVGLAVAALDAIDDPLALVGQQVVSTAALWREVLRPLLSDADSVRLIHPSWWPITRYAVLRAATAGLVDSVQLTTRAEAVLRGEPGSVVVELAPELVAVVQGGEVVGTVSRGPDPDLVVDDVVALLGGRGARSVRVDAPPGVPGGPILMDKLMTRIDAAGMRVESAAPAQLQPGAPQPPTAAEGKPGRPTRRTMAWASALILVLASIMVWHWNTRSEAAAIPLVTLVEGRVAVEVPADWSARRVTAGPGSVRVEVVDSGDSGAVLHLTQAPVHGSDLTTVATQLRDALRAESPAVFLDFNATDHRAGRAAVTYREVRPDHLVRWIVVVDDGLRIGIGCQSPPERSGAIDPDCDRAVRTARRIR